MSTGLVSRYNLRVIRDGLEAEKGTFNICTFWPVEALARASKVMPGRLEDARLVVEQMLGEGNHLGLYAEETGTHEEAPGNFPQAFTHRALISAAYNLDRPLDPARGNTDLRGRGVPFATRERPIFGGDDLTPGMPGIDGPA